MTAAEIKQKVTAYLQTRGKKFVLTGVCFLAVRLLFFSPLTGFSDGLINLLSNRHPPAWLVPAVPGETIDVKKTESYKKQKLTQFKLRVSQVGQDFKHLVGIKAQDLIYKDPDQAGKSPWQNIQLDLASAGDTFVEFWGITIVDYKGQTIVVGEGSQPINLNDRVLRWQTAIEASAKKYQLEPALIAAVIEQESGGDPNSLSPAGAMGLMQLMPSTAESLHVNPFDPAQNIDGGAHYLAIQLKEFGDLPDALAAYNAGPGYVENHTWTKIPETLNYVESVPRLLAKYEQIWSDNEKQQREREETAAKFASP